MTAPNVVNVTTINGHTDLEPAVGTTETVITENDAATPNRVFKINRLTCCNITASAVAVSVEVLRSAVPTRIILDTPVAAGATVSVWGPIYLIEGDQLRVKSDTASSLDVVSSYEIIS